MKRFSEFSKINSTVNETIYKMPTFEDVRKMGKDIHLFDMTEEITLDIPYVNDGDEVYSELLEIMDIVEYTSQHKLQPTRTVCDNILYEFVNYCTMNQLPINKKKIQQIICETDIIGHQLKYKFNRPRPKQLSEIRNIRFMNTNTTNDSPSYPCNHSLQSHTVALYLSNIFPAHSSELLNIAENIGQSRLVLGVQFPSGRDAGVSVGNQLYERLKDKT